MPKKLTRLLATGLGAGLLPKAPGTFGTLAAVPLAWFFWRLTPALSLTLLVVSLAPVALLCGRAAEQAGEEDPGWIVADEIVGYLFATLLVPPEPLSYAVAFFFFRLFDILKPPPVGWFDRAGWGGWSILLDDVAAGLMARGGLYLLVKSGLL